jgi:hypothetical protein
VRQGWAKEVKMGQAGYGKETEGDKEKPGEWWSVAGDGMQGKESL